PATTDPRWPVACSKCAQPFEQKDEFQLFTRQLYVRPDTGERMTLADAPPGGHDWMIDSRCSNCTRKDDNEHFCWVRHGSPEDGTLHVDKVGNTCAAG